MQVGWYSTLLKLEPEDKPGATAYETVVPLVQAAPDGHTEELVLLALDVGDQTKIVSSISINFYLQVIEQALGLEQLQKGWCFPVQVLLLQKDFAFLRYLAIGFGFVSLVANQCWPG